MFRFMIAAAFAAVAGAASAQTTHTATFDVSLGGFRAGILAISGVETATQYSAAGKLQSSGLLRVIREISYDARSTGRITPGGFVPTRYQETANTGERVSRAVMDYVNGVPQVKSYDPPQERSARDVDPATQGGTLDPMTTIYAVLRDAPREDVCTLDVFMFDGRRRSQVTTAAPVADGDKIDCEGQYRRVAGFRESQMADRTVFPFRLTYSPNGDGTYHVTRVVFETLYGKAVLNRR